MSQSGPFDMGKGRNGPGVWSPNAASRPAPIAPYRVDAAFEEFHAVGDVVVCTLAPNKEESKGGVIIPTQLSPFHQVIAVGPKVAEVCGVELEIGDLIAIEGAKFVDTVAGRVWFPRANMILAVVTPKARASSDTLPPPPPQGYELEEPHSFLRRQMRKFIRQEKGPTTAKVIPFQSKQCKIEMGVNEQKQCIYIKMSGANPCVALTAERAEELAVSLQQFVFELRNGGKIG